VKKNFSHIPLLHTNACISMVARVARCVERDGSTSQLTSLRPHSAGISASLEHTFLTSSLQPWRFSEAQLSSATSFFIPPITHPLAHTRLLVPDHSTHNHHPSSAEMSTPARAFPRLFAPHNEAVHPTIKRERDDDDQKAPKSKKPMSYVCLNMMMLDSN
jgi:hypothetical protein